MKQIVLVAGAGPVGLTLAMALKRRGVEVRIIDKSAARTDKSKALVLWSRTLELLDIQGCTAPFLETGMKATGARMLAKGHELVHLPLELSPSLYNYALMIPQSDTERLLEDQLASLGVKVERNVELLSFIDQDKGVSALLSHADGTEETVNAAWLAACDGAHSTIRNQLKLAFDGETDPSDWVLADVQIEGELPDNEISICLTPDGVMAFFPIAGRRFRVIADMGLTRQADAAPLTLEEVQALIDQRGPSGLHAHSPIWLAHFSINERKIKEYRHGHVFLSGDASHIHSPAGGQGMNTGMQDAFNLAWKLALVWHGQASPTLLDSYSPERSAIDDQVLRNAGNLTKAATLRNPLLVEIRSLAASVLNHATPLKQRMVNQLTEMDLHYHDSPLTLHAKNAARHPAVGERTPDVPLVDADGLAGRLHGLLGSGKFVVFSVGTEDVQLPDAVAGIATLATAQTAAGYEPGHVYLIRPDAYLLTSTHAGETAALIEVLQKLATQ